MDETTEITQERRKFARGHHPNSLAERALTDPELKRRLEDGRKEYNADRRAFDAWARQGFAPSIAPNENVYGDQVWDRPRVVA